MIYSPEADILARVRRCRGFEWDEGNSEKNLIKHGVTVAECEGVFEMDPLFVKHDLAHSQQEERFCMGGTTREGRLLVVFFTLRDNLVRIISARDMNSKERRNYGTP